MKKPRWTQTRFPALEVRWTEDIFSPGNGTLQCRIQKNNEEYSMDPVPRRYYNDLLNRPDPEKLFNELLCMYL